jgi:hypothetical protein
MTQTTPQASLNGSRLVRFLVDLSVSNAEVSHKHFTERLGQLIDLSDSVDLAAAHGKLLATSFQPSDVSVDKVIDEYVRVRAAIVKFIINSFILGGGSSWLSLPQSKAGITSEDMSAYQPFSQFYLTHQREMDSKVKQLRLKTRDSVSGLSAKMAQLCALDSALDDTLAIHSRQLFAEVPKLLEKRFKHLFKVHQNDLSGDEDDPQLWMQPGGWLEQFSGEMQGLLLAELDVRLQPILGLIEALNEEVGSIHE